MHGSGFRALFLTVAWCLFVSPSLSFSPPLFSLSLFSLSPFLSLPLTLPPVLFVGVSSLFFRLPFCLFLSPSLSLLPCSLSLSGSVPRQFVSCLFVSTSLSLSLFLVLFLVLPCGHRRFVLCLSVRSILFSSLFASVTPSPCLLSLSLCVKRPAPLLFSSFLFLALAPCLPAFLSSSVPHCPSLSPLCFSLSLSLSPPPSLARSFSLSLSLSLSLCLPLSGLLCLSLVLVPSSHCFSLILGYSV